MGCCKTQPLCYCYRGDGTALTGKADLTVTHATCSGIKEIESQVPVATVPLRAAVLPFWGPAAEDICFSQPQGEVTMWRTPVMTLPLIHVPASLPFSVVREAFVNTPKRLHL